MIDQLEERLRSLDELSRAKRVERIAWLSTHDQLPSAILGRAETLQLLQEAREAFICGHHAAALMLGIAVIEHCVVEAVRLRIDIAPKAMLSQVLEQAENLSILPREWFFPIRQLVSLRNPFAHLKDERQVEDFQRTLGARVMLEKSHPRDLLERDAKEAVIYMYRVFRHTLRGA
jgi:hypothetical protein